MSDIRLRRQHFVYGEVPITKLKYVLKEAIDRSHGERSSRSIMHVHYSHTADLRSICKFQYRELSYVVVWLASCGATSDCWKPWNLRLIIARKRWYQQIRNNTEWMDQSRDKGILSSQHGLELDNQCRRVSYRRRQRCGKLPPALIM